MKRDGCGETEENNNKRGKGKPKDVEKNALHRDEKDTTTLREAFRRMKEMNKHHQEEMDPTIESQKLLRK